MLFFFWKYSTASLSTWKRVFKNLGSSNTLLSWDRMSPSQFFSIESDVGLYALELLLLVSALIMWDKISARVNLCPMTKIASIRFANSAFNQPMWTCV